MSDKTEIQWTTSTWNPLRGTAGKWHCVRVSEGCRHCYAAAMNHRFGGPDYRKGTDTPRLDEKALALPLRWRKPRRVFVCSMTDLFLDEHTDEQIDKVFAVMACARRHTFQVLTKRAKRMHDYLSSRARNARLWKDAARTFGHSLEFEGISLVPFPLPNMWLGVSAEDQRAADERIPLLLDTPAAVRWVSAEPLLGDLDLSPWLGISQYDDGEPWARDTGADLDWVVVGGESGPGARSCDVAWIRSVIEQCRAAGVPCFTKQVGTSIARSVGLRHPKGGDPAEWPDDLRVREFPEVKP